MRIVSLIVVLLLAALVSPQGNSPQIAAQQPPPAQVFPAPPTLSQTAPASGIPDPLAAAETARACLDKHAQMKLAGAAARSKVAELEAQLTAARSAAAAMAGKEQEAAKAMVVAEKAAQDVFTAYLARLDAAKRVLASGASPVRQDKSPQPAFAMSPSPSTFAARKVTTAQAVLIVNTHEEAQVIINGNPTTSKGKQRSYETGVLSTDQEYDAEVIVLLAGKEIFKKTVPIKAGAEMVVDAR